MTLPPNSPPARPGPPPPLPPPTPPPPPAPSPADPPGSLVGVVDTIESIVIALILALTFRAFVVEAFVIPTGSMAPTLLGAHFNDVCPKCGWDFKEGADLNQQLDDRGGRPVMRPTPRGELSNNYAIAAPARRACQNCGYQISADPADGQMPGRPRVETVGGERMYFPWANNGDRILVLKYLYNFISPKRWDVIVFKEPMGARDNYIKRLLGLPGETVEIIEGDVFITPPGADPADLGRRQIARKDRHVQDAVWQLVYDNDRYPTDPGAPRPPDSKAKPSVPWQNPWRDETPGWTRNNSEVTYTGAGPGVLAFRPTQPFYLYNVLSYNTLVQTRRGLASDFVALEEKERVPVGDLRLQTVWTPQPGTLPDSSDAAVTLVVGMPSNQIRAQWQRSGRIVLARWDPAGQKFVETQTATVAPPQPGRAYRLALSNIDRQAQFFIDGRLAASHETPWSAAAARAWSAQLDEQRRNKSPEIPQVRIEVAGPCTLGHLQLFRDLYYTQIKFGNTDQPGTGTMDRPITLGQGGANDEFFALGDNSTASFDSRGWNRVDESLADLPAGKERHYGCIPRRFLLGRAFFVYWPAGFRPMNGAPGKSWPALVDPPLVPNTGEMRFIR